VRTDQLSAGATNVRDYSKATIWPEARAFTRQQPLPTLSDYERIYAEIYAKTLRATNAHHPTPIQNHHDKHSALTSTSTSITMVSPPPLSPLPLFISPQVIPLL